MKILALDVGERRIGVAVTDPLGTIAQPLMTINRDEISVQRIIDLVNEREIDEIVVGLPVNMNGTTGPRAEDVREYAEHLMGRTTAALIFIDERLTTVEAEKLMISADVRRQKRKQRIDSIAAAIILEKRLRELSNRTQS